MSSRAVTFSYHSFSEVFHDRRTALFFSLPPGLSCPACRLPAGKSVEARVWAWPDAKQITTVVFALGLQSQFIQKAAPVSIQGNELIGQIGLAALKSAGVTIPADFSGMGFQYQLFVDNGSGGLLAQPCQKKCLIESSAFKAPGSPSGQWQQIYAAPPGNSTTPTTPPPTDQGGALKLYADFNDGKLPTTSDWGKAWDQSKIVANVVNGQLRVTPKLDLSEGRLSFGNTASIIEYDVNIESVKPVSPHFQFELFNFARMIESAAAIVPYVTVSVRFPSVGGTLKPEMDFYVARWDFQNRKVASNLFDTNAGSFDLGKAHRVRISWLNDKITFSMDGVERASHTFSASYAQSLKAHPTPTIFPVILLWMITWQWIVIWQPPTMAMFGFTPTLMGC